MFAQIGKFCQIWSHWLWCIPANWNREALFVPSQFMCEGMNEEQMKNDCSVILSISLEIESLGHHLFHSNIANDWIRWNKKQFKNQVLSSGCGSFVRADADDTRGLRFESRHRRIFILDIYLLTALLYWKDEKKKKRGRKMAHFFKRNKSAFIISNSTENLKA